MSWGGNALGGNARGGGPGGRPGGKRPGGKRPRIQRKVTFAVGGHWVVTMEMKDTGLLPWR